MSRATVMARPAGPGPAPPGPGPSARRRAAVQEHAMRLSGALRGPDGPRPARAAAADGSLRVAGLRDATIIRIDPATG
jgi:hypothetical protein